MNTTNDAQAFRLLMRVRFELRERFHLCVPAPNFYAVSVDSRLIETCSSSAKLCTLLRRLLRDEQSS